MAKQNIEVVTIMFLTAIYVFKIGELLLERISDNCVKNNNA